MQDLCLYSTDPTLAAFARGCRSYGSQPVTRAKTYRSYLEYLDHQEGIDRSIICPTCAIVLKRVTIVSCTDWFKLQARSLPRRKSTPFFSGQTVSFCTRLLCAVAKTSSVLCVLPDFSPVEIFWEM